MRKNINPRTIFLLFLLALLVFGVANVPGRARAQAQHQAGLVITFADGSSITECISFSQPSITGYDLLQQSSQPVVVEFLPSGVTVCKIGPQGCPADNCFCNMPDYWNYYHQVGGKWEYSQSGSSAYDVQDNAVEGWAWGATGSEPALITIDQICAPPPAPTDTPPPPTSTSVPPSATPKLPTATQFQLTSTPTQQEAQPTDMPPGETPVYYSATPTRSLPSNTPGPTHTLTASQTRVATHTPTLAFSATLSATSPVTDTPTLAAITDQTHLSDTPQYVVGLPAISAGEEPMNGLDLRSYVVFGILMIGLITAYLIRLRRKK